MLMVMEVRRERRGMLVDTRCSTSFLVHDTANDLNPECEIFKEIRHGHGKPALYFWAKKSRPNYG